MAKKNKISQIKKVKIISNVLMNNSTKGTFFNYKNPKPDQLIPLARLSASIDYYNEVITELEKNPLLLKYIPNSIYKKDVKDLESPELFTTDLESEFAWAKIILSKCSEKINDYLNLYRQYSEYLFNGEYENASKILLSIENEFGYSLWLIKNKIALLQLTEGLEAQKNYTQQIKNELPNGTLCRVITHWTSVKNETQSTFLRYSQQIESICNKLDPVNQLGYREYMRYHLLDKEDFDPEKYMHVLRISYSSSLIDYYEAFVSFLRVLCVNPDQRFRSKVLNTISNKKLLFNDDRLDFFKSLLNIQPFNQNQFAQIEAFDNIVDLNFEFIDKSLYSFSNFQLKMIADSLKRALISPNLIDVEDCNVNVADNSIKEKIENKLSRVIRHGIIEASEEFNYLNKLAINFSGYSWSTLLVIALNKEDPSYNEQIFDSEILALKVPIFHPYFITCYSDGNSLETYKEICVKYYNNSSYLNYCLSLIDLNKLEIPVTKDNIYSDLIKGLIDSKRGDLDLAIDFGKKLIDSNIFYFKRRGFGLVSHSHFRLRDYRMACKSIADCYVNYSDFYPFLPLALICEEIKSGTPEWESVSSLIDFSIVIDAYNNHIDKNLEIERKFAYEDFLIKNGMSKPSELEYCIGEFELKKIVYYLRFVCIESTMDTSGAFGGSSEVIQERLQICRILVNIDPSNEEIYRKEINEIVRRQIIASRRKEVDQSRIYVDTKNVKNYCETELKESFNRYIAYLKFNLKFSLAKGKITNSILNSTMNIPDDEVNSLLRLMIQEITDAYLSPDFGLDRFLSTRIRHGILEGHLRRPIQNHNLITNREFKNGPYLRNNYWLEKLSSKSLINKFNSAFSKFSESYDNLIGTIISWLQINKKGGLINFSFSDDDIKTISSKITKETKLIEFIDLIINVLDSTLVVHLITIREELNGTAKTIAKQLLTELQESTIIANNQTSNELHNSISKARTDLQVQFDKIIEWFVPPSTGDSTPYIIEDALVVAEAQIKESDPLFTIDVESDEENSFEIHGFLPIFVDIFVNIFENVVKRSELNEPKALIKLSVNQPEEGFATINIEISNELGSTINIKELDAEMKRKMVLLEQESYAEYLASEKNSGLFKIHKSVKDFKATGSDISPTVEFGVKNNLFVVSISITFKLYSLD
jgi:hypothetical protein